MVPLTDPRTREKVPVEHSMSAAIRFTGERASTGRPVIRGRFAGLPLGAELIWLLVLLASSAALDGVRSG
jgi:hypothetical protein